MLKGLDVVLLICSFGCVRRWRATGSGSVFAGFVSSSVGLDAVLLMCSPVTGDMKRPETQ